MTEHQKCAFEGCQARFDPASVRAPGPRNDPPGDTGWYWPADAPEEDPELPAHDHAAAEVR